MITIVLADDDPDDRLLTEEAFKMYLTKLEPHGVIAVHISNRFLDLDPVLLAISNDLHLTIRLDDDQEPSEKEIAAGFYQSRWVVMAHDKADLGGIARDTAFSEVFTEHKIPAWTDDFSNVLGVFKVREER